MESKKISDNEIEITKTETTTKTNTYSYEFLVNQRATIIKDANTYLAARTKEIEEVDALLAECENLGVTLGSLPQPLIKEEV